MASRYNEYTGFMPASSSIDWAKLTGGLVSTITGIGEEREAQRQELDKLQTDNIKILQNTELGKSQTFNQLILSGSNDGRQSIMEWNRQLKSGEITPLEYKNRINNLMGSWSTFANTAKTFDQQIQEALKRQQEGLGSSLELELNNRLAQLANLKNKKTQVDRSNGNFLIGQLDDNGLFDPSSVMDLRSISQPGNVIDNRIDLDAIVDEKTKNIASWVKETGRTTTTDPLLNPVVQKSIYDLSKAILNNPRAITGVLTNNTDGNYDFYYSENDLTSKLQDRVAKENEFRSQNNKPLLSGDELTKFINDEKDLFILLKQDDQGVYQPNVTNEQVKRANEAVENRIKSRLERKVELDEPQYSGGGGGRGGSTDSDNFAISTYITSNEALNEGSFEKLDNEKYNFKQGVDENGKKYVLVTSRIYDEKTKSYIDNPKTPDRRRVYRADGLAQYIKGMDPKAGETADAIYNSGKDDYYKLNQQYLEGTYKGNKKSQSNTSSKPKKGDVVSGYIFLGGDPSNQNNWKKK